MSRFLELLISTEYYPDIPNILNYNVNHKR